MKEAYLKIEGWVQRVGFRRWVIAQARDIGGLSGWVRNIEDGSVEIMMLGEETAINEMVKRCYSGPLFARVDKVAFMVKSEVSFLPPIQQGRFICL